MTCTDKYAIMVISDNIAKVCVKGGTMKYFLAFDVGTTAMKCILYDKEFN